MAALAEIAELVGGSPFTSALTSRATWFRRAPWCFANEMVPVIAGQTVWGSALPEPNQVQVLEQPNYFGRYERDRPPGDNTVTVRRWGKEMEDTANTIVDLATHVGSVETARNLAGALRQIPGTWLPHGQPESPWFIISLPAHPDRASADLASAGYQGCAVTGAQFPEFHGGLRIEVAWPKSENDQIVRTIRAAMNL